MRIGAINQNNSTTNRRLNKSTSRYNPNLMNSKFNYNFDFSRVQTNESSRNIPSKLSVNANKTLNDPTNKNLFESLFGCCNSTKNN